MSGRRGSPSCPRNSAAAIAPTPPAAKTRPSPSAPPSSEFLTTYGISTYTGPRKNRSDSVSAPSVAQSHVWERTYAMPSAMSRPIEPRAPESGTDRVRISRKAAAENANDPASTRNAVPAPARPISTPPTAGPISRTQSGRTNWSSEFASSSRSRGTTSRTIPVNDGAKSAPPAP